MTCLTLSSLESDLPECANSWGENRHLDITLNLQKLYFLPNANASLCPSSHREQANASCRTCQTLKTTLAFITADELCCGQLRFHPRGSLPDASAIKTT